MISQTIFAVSTQDIRPVHTGALFEVENDSLTVVSLDGFRLALRREKYQKNLGDEHYTFVVPAFALSEVEKICAETDEPISITQGPAHVLFTIGETIVVSRRLEGDFLNYKQSIPKENKINVVGATRDLLTSIGRVSLILSDKLKTPCAVPSGKTNCLLPPNLPLATPPTSAHWRVTAAGWRSASTTAISPTLCVLPPLIGCAWNSPPPSPPASFCLPRRMTTVFFIWSFPSV